MRIALAAALTAPTLAFAAGGLSPTPPAPTETTTECPEGQVWDAEADRCTAIEDAALDAEALFEAARELAHAGRIADARAALARMPDPAEGRVLTYTGFTARKMGDVDAAEGFYRAALTADPDDLMARSYMGQGHAEAGRRAEARAQLTEIRARGGRGTWPEISLRLAIEGGTGPSY